MEQPKRRGRPPNRPPDDERWVFILDEFNGDASRFEHYGTLEECFALNNWFAGSRKEYRGKIGNKHGVIFKCGRKKLNGIPMDPQMEFVG